jgi:hypothetical protein
MSDEDRELRAIVMDGPMPPAQSDEPQIEIPMPTLPPMPGGIGRSISATEASASLADLLREQETFALPHGAAQHGWSPAAQQALRQEYHVIDRVVRMMRDAGLTNQTIVGVLNGTPAALDMARTSLRLQVPGQEISLRNTQLDPGEALRAIAGSPAARVYLRQHLAELSRQQSYDEIVQNQEHRRDEQERLLREQVAAARLAETDMPSTNMLNSVLLNQQTLADIRRWGTDEVDPETRREVMRNFDGIDRFPQMPMPEITRNAVFDGEDRLLKDWLWHELLLRTDRRPTDGPHVFRGQDWVRFFYANANDIFGPFHIQANIQWDNDQMVCRRDMKLQLTPSQDSRDILNRPICSRLIAYPSILLVFNDGRFWFANYSHRNDQAEVAGDPSVPEADLRGRHGGSSSHTGDGGGTRRARALNLDL